MSSHFFAFPMLFLHFIFSSAFSSSFAHSIHDDRQSLLAFKKVITGDPNNSMADWSLANPLYNWTAVTCSRRHPDKVVGLNLTGMDLRGSISPFLGNLSFLRSLDLSGNALHGHVPPQLGRLFRLRELRLHANQLDGNVPSQLSNCTHMGFLALSFNKLSGNIPPVLGSLAHLQSLFLAVNKLTGTIPFSFGNLSALINLSLEENNLIGAIPPQLALLRSLQLLTLNTNELSGTIPQELGLLTRLQTLYLSENELSGTIPTSLSNISTLIDLELSANKLTGIIPQELGLLTNLQTLALDQNKLLGPIPISLSNIFNLNQLSLWGNQLTGNIPNSIGNCSKLTMLALANNKLTGSVPMELGKLSFLEILELQYNQLGTDSDTTMLLLVTLTNCSSLKKLVLKNNKLSGPLPLTIGKLSTNLQYLSLANNIIQGNIPPHMNNLSSLTLLDLSENCLNGSIPQLGNLQRLERLYLMNNRLEGDIPDDFEQLQHLGLLDISGNILSGKIPSSLASLKQLRRLFLHHNKLLGSIPENLGDSINLELLDLSHNMLTGSIPREIMKLQNVQFYLNLSWNLLEGSLPREIGKIAMAQAIDISANQLTGAIPSTLGSCVELQSLNLSQNAFQGSIPDTLGNLQSLMNLDLSSNFLSGTIPDTLKKLKMLEYLNLSFNNLKGEIPEGGFFPNRTIIMSLIGNPSLCGPQILRLPACPTPRGHFAFVKKVLLLVSGAISFILCCLTLGFLSRGNMNMKKYHFSLSIFQKLYPKISYQDLHVATNGFTKANLLGKGNFGLVYKGTLTDGTLVAIKVLQLENDQAEKSFKAECSVLQKVRHRNLVRIITSCSNLHFKGLIFQFMSNGSLEKHLYPDRDDNNDEGVCELGLKTRLDIAIDVAHAMEYLHHYCFVQVVHCDIKPSNVLLDEDMSGHVTDFGIARLIGATSTDSLTSTLHLKGSIGYIAPEYGFGETISTKGDVYSYGILLLEMLTRKRPTDEMFIGDLHLHKWVNLAFPNRVKEIIDNAIFNEMDGDEFEETNLYRCLLSLLRVGLLCSTDSPNERPIMKDVVTMLESLRENLEPNEIASMRLRRSISNLLSNTNATTNGAPASNDYSSSTF